MCFIDIGDRMGRGYELDNLTGLNCGRGKVTPSHNFTIDKGHYQLQWSVRRNKSSGLKMSVSSELSIYLHLQYAQGKRDSICINQRQIRRENLSIHHQLILVRTQARYVSYRRTNESRCAELKTPTSYRLSRSSHWNMSPPLYRPRKVPKSFLQISVPQCTSNSHMQ